MKLRILAFLLLITPAFGQSDPNLYGVAFSFNPGAPQRYAGTVLYGHQLSGSNTYALTVADFVPQSVQQAIVLTNIGAGVAQKAVSFGNLSVWALGSAGVSFSSQATGWQYAGGGAVTYPIGKKGLKLLVGARFSKSSIGGASYQLIPSAGVAW